MCTQERGGKGGYGRGERVGIAVEEAVLYSCTCTLTSPSASQPNRKRIRIRTECNRINTAEKK